MKTELVDLRKTGEGVYLTRGDVVVEVAPRPAPAEMIWPWYCESLLDELSGDTLWRTYTHTGGTSSNYNSATEEQKEHLYTEFDLVRFLGSNITTATKKYPELFI